MGLGSKKSIQGQRPEFETQHPIDQFSIINQLIGVGAIHSIRYTHKAFDAFSMMKCIATRHKRRKACGKDFTQG